MTTYPNGTGPGSSRADPEPRSPKRSASPKKELPGALHRALRAATRNDLAMIDRLLLRLNLSRKEDYALFLHIHYSALSGLEADWRAEDRADFVEMLQCVQADLHVLGTATIPIQPKAATPGLQCHRAGVAYVIRGSRLGAAFLRRAVPSQFPTAYLDFVPELAWPQFLQQLERILDDSSNGNTQDAIHGARVTFETFAAQYTRAMA